MDNWINKYQPKGLKDVVGQDEAISQLRAFIDSFKRQKTKKYVFLYGPTGCGKTSAVYALSNDYNFDILELNASEYRNQKTMSQLFSSAMGQRSLLFKERLLLIDELDGISSTKDRGGISYLTKIISGIKTPVVLIANDPFKRKFSSLRKKSVMVEFKPLSNEDIVKILKKIVVSEKIDCSDDILKRVARMSGGDARSAINDLWILSINKRKIEVRDLDVLSYRNKEETIMNGLIKVFRSSSLDTAIKAFDSVDELPNEILLWIDENIPYEYKEALEISNAYDWVSKADIFNSRIRNRQYWRFLVYIMLFITGGVNISKTKKYVGFVKYKQPDIKLKIWIYNNKTKKINDIMSRLMPGLHLSTSAMRNEVYPYLKVILRNKRFRGNILREFNLTSEDIDYITK